MTSLKWMLVAMLCLTPVSGSWAVGSDDDSAPPEYAEAVKAVKAENFEAALPLFQKVVAQTPDNANAWNYIGYSYRKLKKFDAAMTAYKKALALDPNHRGANEYMGELYLRMDDLAKAKERLKVLDSACFFGCQEFDELKEAIAEYEKKKAGG